MLKIDSRWQFWQALDIYTRYPGICVVAAAAFVCSFLHITFFSDLHVIEWDRGSLVKDDETRSLVASLQVLQCLQPCLAQVLLILYAETQRILLQQRYVPFTGGQQNTAAAG